MEVEKREELGRMALHVVSRLGARERLRLRGAERRVLEMKAG